MAAKRVMLAVEKASKKSRFWRRVKELLSRPGSRAPEVNVGKIAHLTAPGDRVVVPGKVLGKGEINHSITIAAFSFSSSALSKLKTSGCAVMPIDEFTEVEPRGSGVKIIV